MTLLQELMLIQPMTWLKGIAILIAYCVIVGWLASRIMRYIDDEN